jgi:hypothetical protein
MYYWQMNGQGMRQESTPVLPLKVLNQAGFLELFEQRGQLLPVGGESPGMLQKSSGAGMVIDINKVLGGTDAAFAAKPTQGPQTSSDVSHGAGKRFQPFHHCSNPL